ncbi:50S ribosomal protein L22 [uncultured Ferrovibrio sp.]|jgi:large subunit ribosomal protein L22|uniref:50S ribosomal protein L22 n=1 Tax=uncultured Ferrovibrio sp. TaxID=1576913 RepID=UPI002625338D|nr:50S ribosomal protein L22 [uncultured Ferrovibrio sp.]
MSKQARESRLGENEAMAVGRNIRVSPRKLGVVAGLIRGKRVEAALSELTFSKRRIAKDVKKVLQSAIANAENNHQLDVDRLVVSEASVGKGLVMRRFHARARGRGAKILKPFSHLTIVVREREEEKKAPAKAKSTGAKKAAPKKAEAQQSGEQA